MATTPVGRRQSQSQKRRESTTADTGGRSGKPNEMAGVALDSAADRSAQDVARAMAASGSLDLELPAEPASVPLSRHRLEHWLSNIDASPDDVFAITLAANEACSNAIEHAYGGERGFTFRLLAEHSSDVVMIKVLDSGRWRTPRGSERGRGLRIIEQLMDAVDVQSTAAGTTVRMRKALADH
jgi:anti-sigma regulatory factor (Ser/Thr protein kinase)